MYADDRRMHNHAFIIEETDVNFAMNEGGMGMKRRVCTGLNAGYTVEAAGVMSAVLLTIMVLLCSAFHIHHEVLTLMRLHTSVEQARHAISAVDEDEISMEAEGNGGTLAIRAPVFRPENSLRMWSLLEGKE